jgi:hypothetical protein
MRCAPTIRLVCGVLRSVQGQITLGSWCRPFWVIVQHQPYCNRGGHRSQEDGQILGPDIHWLDVHSYRGRLADHTTRRQQSCQVYRLPACHRWRDRHHLRRYALPDPGIHPSHPICSCYGPLRVLAQLWLRESSPLEFPLADRVANDLPNIDLGCHRWWCHHSERAKEELARFFPCAVPTGR